MSDLIRFGISLPKGLLKTFDSYIRKRNYTNRSEAIRDLIRKGLIDQQWENSGKKIAGAITFIYDHHVRQLMNKITSVQHDFHTIIISTQHIHLDHDNCLEIIAIRGNSREVRTLYDKISSIKGVKHTALSMSATGKDLH